MARPLNRRDPRAGREARRSVENVRIGSIATGGEGVGRLRDGRAVFVHRTAPGEDVEVQIISQRPRWARGRLLRVLQASEERRLAPCPHYRDCGGCTLEHLVYHAQLEAKRKIVEESLRRIGGSDVGVPPVQPSPREFHYRNRVSFALRRGGAGEIMAGFHALHDPGRIVNIDGECLLPEEPISRVWDALRREWGADARRLPSGETLRLTLRATSSGSVSLLVEGGYSPGRPAELIETVEGLESIWHRPESASAADLIAGAPGLPETWGEDSFELGGTAFLQVNREAAANLEGYVVAIAGDVTGLEVVDAYCGIGSHARRLAAAGARATGIELDPDAVRAALALASPRTRFLEGRVEDLLPPLLPADLVILNPPRAGVATEIVQALLEKPPSRIVYVSCDPATLARDVKRASPAFTVSSVKAFDLFPQTSHVETVLELTRR